MQVRVSYKENNLIKGRIMNEDSEKTLRDKIKSIQHDPTLTPNKKQSLQKVLHQSYQSANFNTLETFNALETNNKSSCQYYPSRKCSLECVLCKKYYHCRFCHNDAEDHKFDRQNVQNVCCLECNTIQSPDVRCHNCDVQFGDYYCDRCHLYADTTEIFHCDGCGICRKGLKELYRHCDKCNMCISVSAGGHTCFSNTFEGNCAICSESLFDVIEYGSLLKCGHAIHQTCMRHYAENNYRCPLCKKSMIDMAPIWEDLSEKWKDALLVRDDNKIVDRYCNDCCKTFQNSYSPFALYRCPHCFGFNNC